MKIALITPANKSHMPYLKNYQMILDELKVDYDIFSWDRLQNEELSYFSYRDKKTGIQRGFVGYFKYCKYLKGKIKEKKYDKLIVFGLPILFFLKKELIRNYKGKYLIDVRDKNKIIEYFDFKKIFEHASGVILSSEKYKEWLFPEISYIINHNTLLGIDKKYTLLLDAEHMSKEDIMIKSVGTIRDFEINKLLITSLKNIYNFKLEFIGDGDVINKLKNDSDVEKISNVKFFGRYEQKQEEEILRNSTIINVLRYPDSENNKTALPNRLYSALKLSKPLLSYKGTYLADIIEEYNLGIVIDSFNNVDKKIEEYLSLFPVHFQEGRIKFLNKVKQENQEFVKSIENFIRGY